MVHESNGRMQMTKRLQVLLDDDEYRDVQRAAQGDRMTVSEWVRRVLRQARFDRRGSTHAKLHAVAEAARHEFPTADIDDMLREMEQGYRVR